MSNKKKNFKPSKSSYMRAARKQKMAENRFINKYEKEEEERYSDRYQYDKDVEFYRKGWWTLNNLNKNDDQSTNKNIVMSIPLSVLVSAITSTYHNVFNIVFLCMKFVAISYICYLILGKVLFVGLIVTSLLVSLIYYAIATYEVVNSELYDFDDEDDFDDHWDDKLK